MKYTYIFLKVKTKIGIPIRKETDKVYEVQCVFLLTIKLNFFFIVPLYINLLLYFKFLMRSKLVNLSAVIFLLFPSIGRIRWCGVVSRI